MQRRTSSDSSGAAKAEKAIGWRGSALDDWKPMSRVGPGTIEIRIHMGMEHRVFVVSKFEEAIYVLHAFDKKSKQTSKHDLDLATRRYRDLLVERRQR
jgi:phage-related protein